MLGEAGSRPSAVRILGCVCEEIVLAGPVADS